MAKKTKKKEDGPFKVMCKRPGYYDNVLRREGEVFICKKQVDFTDSWMVVADKDSEVGRPQKEALPPGHIASPVSTVRKEIERLEKQAAEAEAAEAEAAEAEEAGGDAAVVDAGNEGGGEEI